MRHVEKWNTRTFFGLNNTMLIIEICLPGSSGKEAHVEARTSAPVLKISLAWHGPKRGLPVSAQNVAGKRGIYRRSSACRAGRRTRDKAGEHEWHRGEITRIPDRGHALAV